MTLLDCQTTSTTDSPVASADESYTTDYFTFVPGLGAVAEPDLADLAELEALIELDSFQPPAVLSAAAPTLVDEETDAADDDLSTAYARCSDGAGTLTHLFFSDDNFDLARAKAICGKCRLAPDCLDNALDRKESYGVWGGELLIDGVIVAVKRGRGRPPKQPRGPIVTDEVPVPPHLVA